MVADQLKEWWVQALLGQQRSAHPVFGNDIDVQVDDGVVTLHGTVDTETEAEELEQEARKLGPVRDVINHLVVTGPARSPHRQTVIALFPSAAAAELACNAVSAATLHEDRPPDLLSSVDEARQRLSTLAEAAQAPSDSTQRYLDVMKDGKVLLVDRVPELDALRVVSALEGSSAEHVWTLPPEPDVSEVS